MCEGHTLPQLVLGEEQRGITQAPHLHGAVSETTW